MFRFMLFLPLVASFVTLNSLYTYAGDKEELLPTKISFTHEQNNLLITAGKKLYIANYFLETDKYKEAALEYEESIIILEGLNVTVGGSPYENAGLSNFLSANVLKAIKYYEAAKKCNMEGKLENFQNYLCLATAYAQTEKHEQALENFISFFNKMTATANIYFAAGQSAIKSEKWEKAVELYNKGFDLVATPNAYAYANSGRAHLELKNYVSAHNYLEKAIQLKPDLPQIVYDRLRQAEVALKESK